MILVIDNYDSFTYNLVQLIESYYPDVKVITNDALNVDDIIQLKPKGIVLSPGPGTPDQAGIILDLVQQMYDKQPILGICLGHQTIAQAFGGKIVASQSIQHGRLDLIDHDANKLFKHIDGPFQATRYHSLTVDEESLPKQVKISARSNSDGSIMAIRHVDYPVEGLQFHPESYLTNQGHIIIQNFIDLVKKGGRYV